MNTEPLHLPSGKVIEVCARCGVQPGEVHQPFCPVARTMPKRAIALHMLWLDARADKLERIALELSALPEADGVIPAIRCRANAKNMRARWWEWAALLMDKASRGDLNAADVSALARRLDQERRLAEAG